MVKPKIIRCQVRAVQRVWYKSPAELPGKLPCQNSHVGGGIVHVYEETSPDGAVGSSSHEGFMELMVDHMKIDLVHSLGPLYVLIVDEAPGVEERDDHDLDSCNLSPGLLWPCLPGVQPLPGLLVELGVIHMHPRLISYHQMSQNAWAVVDKACPEVIHCHSVCLLLVCEEV